MTSNHLTDAEVQEIAEVATLANESLKHHLKTCPVCREKLMEYQVIYNAIRNQPVPEIPQAFADHVVTLALLKPGRQIVKTYRIVSTIIIILSIVIFIFIFLHRRTLKLLHESGVSAPGHISLPEMVLFTAAIGLFYVCIKIYRKSEDGIVAFQDLSL
jgi:hypothetical protein